MVLVCRCGLGHGPRLDHGIAEVLLITGRVRAPAASIPDRTPVGPVLHAVEGRRSPRFRRRSSVRVSPAPDPGSGGVRPRARRPGPWQWLRAHRHPGVFGLHDPPPTARLGRARRGCGTAQSRARRLRPDDRPRPRRPVIGWVDHQSPCGGELSGRSPVDRGKQGTERSVVTDGTGIPLALVGAGANRHDSPLFEPPCARSRT